jgi:hypothetical protein
MVNARLLRDLVLWIWRQALVRDGLFTDRALPHEDPVEARIPAPGAAAPGHRRLLARLRCGKSAVSRRTRQRPVRIDGLAAVGTRAHLVQEAGRARLDSARVKARAPVDDRWCLSPVLRRCRARGATRARARAHPGGRAASYSRSTYEETRLGKRERESC